MEAVALSAIVSERTILKSLFLARDVIVDIYHPKKVEASSVYSLLFINDGQDLEKMPFSSIFNELEESKKLCPLICVGIHASIDRRMEYGTAKILDYSQRGAKAAAHNQFVLEELVPLLKTRFLNIAFSELSYAGFSLGGLSAIDIVWNYPKTFKIAGVFSGSLWWRSKDLDEGYNEETDRIMHEQIKDGKYHAGLRFYFTTGSQDETADRNGNGIIDSIDDTLGLIDELKKKGYTDQDIKYVNYEDGRHDMETWARALPAFLEWGWGCESKRIVFAESC